MNPESIKRSSHVLDSTFYRGVRVRGTSSGRIGTIKSDTYASDRVVEVVWDDEGGYISRIDRSFLRVVSSQTQPEDDKAVLRRMHAEQSRKVTEAASVAALAGVAHRKELDKLAAISLLLSN